MQKANIVCVRKFENWEIANHIQNSMCDLLIWNNFAQKNFQNVSIVFDRFIEIV